MRYLIETYGCQMNKAESSALETMLRERSWSPCLPEETPDIVLINTCSVRATAENRAWGRIDHFAARKRELRAQGHKAFALVITGCMAERMKDEIRSRQPEVDQVLGTFQKQAFGLVLDAVAADRPLGDIEESPAFIFSSSYHEPGSFRSFLPIMHGCDNFCSYCIVPYLRGREVSRRPSAILAELVALEDSGVREVTLLGQNVNSYSWKASALEGKGAGIDVAGIDASGIDASGIDAAGIDAADLDFPGLLRLVAAHLKGRGKGGIRWVRFLSSHPKDLSDEVIAVLAEEDLYCRHIHLCVQSGSDPVLKAMNRRYTRAWYLELVGRLKARVPGLSLSTDILVGFPGETEEDLEATIDLIREVGFSYSYMYYFNPREGTPAATMDGRVGDKVKKARLARVIEAQAATTRASMEARVGAVDEVFVESLSKRRKTEVLGRTQRDEMVVFPAPASKVGSFARVRLVSLSGNTFMGEELDGTA